MIRASLKTKKRLVLLKKRVGLHSLDSVIDYLLQVRERNVKKESVEK